MQPSNAAILIIDVCDMCYIDVCDMLRYTVSTSFFGRSAEACSSRDEDDTDQHSLTLYTGGKIRHSL